MTDTAIGDLNSAERAVWFAYSRGAWVDLRTGKADEDRLSVAHSWPKSRVVRAEVISALLAGAAEPHRGRSAALRLRGARITGRLDLGGATLDHVLAYEYCVFEDALDLVDARTRSVRIVESALPALSGARLRAEGIIDLTGSVIEQRLSLERAAVAGELRLRRTVIGRDSAVTAVSADGLSVDGLVDCSDGFTCVGAIQLREARITGSLDLGYASLTAVGSPALRADNVVIGGRLSATGLQAVGEVRISNMRIAGWLSLIDANLRNPGDVALGAGGLSVGGGLWCGGSFVAQGQIRLVGASVGGNLSLAGAELSHPDGDALNLDRATLGDVDAARLRVRGGRVSMRNTQITGQVSLAAAHLDAGAGKTALTMDEATVMGSLDLRGLHARGELSLRTCAVSGRVSLVKAVLENESDIAMRLSRSRIAADLFCGEMTVRGTLKLTGATVGSDLLLNEVSLSSPGGVALDARNLRAGTLALLPREPIEGRVLLQDARLGRLRDDPQRWPAEPALGGLTYADLEPHLPARDRLRWLPLGSGGFQPQPYEQLANWYMANGQPAEARRVLHMKERRQRGTKPFSGRLWGFLQDATVAYGYQPWRAVIWFLGLLAAGSATYAACPPPALDPAQAPHFNPVFYTLDLLLPVIDLGQKHAYNPSGAEQWVSYVLIAAGWVLATTIAAGAARTLNRG